ncbi:mandelate racemase/muconate lactonizing enzyme family protein [Alicyclobacillus cycloheptanicus]|uniref:L-alanine-DL-glutamate epimerase-like enolase superfamily enzyme n=1 Tax=Alicyclobacillus cycloheptanicus TaxID=1457 RepID=A0ABT9XP82_9BACL|nr:mandelate racemase/muconate lactonizing enzyme family protein [Alicyclobacillus cycloheptanicus]MDQ0191568.1 L-alanine-DL-glutamate epimerase-like enolase superfamily enzyme [Alicyclobacillus cycloheptanicus]WDM02431.1 mandelate racemase/muconate lactonizing enzyme family protein [Alicyclobacillus cycloheptanicus]
MNGIDSTNPGPVKITRIETDVLRVPLETDYKGSYYHMTHRATIFTRIYTDQGVVGEIYTGDEDDGNAEIQKIIHDEIAPKLIGEDALAIERIWELTRPVTFNILRDRRLGLVAQACIDEALWDIFGKVAGQPLWRLWGGYTNTRPIICTGGYYGTGVSIEEELTRIYDMGYRGMKFKVGGKSPEEDAARFIEARKAAGPDFILIADANQGWDVDEATKFAKLVEEYDLYYFEEPCNWANDHRYMRDVRYKSGARVCAGQSELSAAGCRDLMEHGAIDFCNFDGSWSGGPTEWRRVAAIATAYGVQMAHHEEAQISAHLLSSIPHGTFVDTFVPERDPIWWNIITNRPEIQDGRISVGEAPGYGWEYDDKYIDKYSVSHVETTSAL